MSHGPARTLAAAGTAGAGAAVAAAAYLIVGGHSGMLYAAGICAATFLGVLAIVSSGSPGAVAPATDADARPPRWRRKSRRISELEADLAAGGVELEKHRHALAELGTQLAQESEAARVNAQQLEQRIRELEAERDGLQELVASERERFEQTLDELGGGIGGHANELARLERELAALIAG